MSSNNVIEFPKIFNKTNAQGIAEALVDYVKDMPNAKLLVVVSNPSTSELTMGWNPMDAGEMSLMLRFANYKWEKQTFEDYDALYEESGDE